MAPAPHVDGDPFWGLVRSRRRGPLQGAQSSRPFDIYRFASASSRAELIKLGADLFTSSMQSRALLAAQRLSVHWIGEIQWLCVDREELADRPLDFGEFFTELVLAIGGGSSLAHQADSLQRGSSSGG